MEFMGGETSLIVALPNKIDGLDDLIKKIKDPAILHEVLSKMSLAEVQVTLPRFVIETTSNLKCVLEQVSIN